MRWWPFFRRSWKPPGREKNSMRNPALPASHERQAGIIPIDLVRAISCITSTHYICPVQLLRSLFVWILVVALAVPRPAFHFLDHLPELVDHVSHYHSGNHLSMLVSFLYHAFPHSEKDDHDHAGHHKHLPCGHSHKIEVPTFLVWVPFLRVLPPNAGTSFHTQPTFFAHPVPPLTGYMGKVWQPPRQV